ncbi:hypothetical protein VA596_09440 [Amycolatopsis sp., V23-08]|uniref:Uncharacterized protein n=1 Tax=Amycolatopsis heterodermiae TaxID=3110235 RepID=A0ABU5R1P9_9PSEU|nr:hypothetical protein [Amycolatopsis sp., V23-08]MEA5359759.1 hypothetical protein [Amycolatopsis sp., V23-08]
MTDLERKLAETLREQGGEVTPNLDAAWAEQMRRQRRRPRRRLTVIVAPLAAVLVVLTSVSLATRMNTAPAPLPPANPGQELVVAKPEVIPPATLSGGGEPVTLTDFVGQTENWTSYAVAANDPTGRKLFCVESLPKGVTGGTSGSQYGIESPSCVPISRRTVRAGYVGKTGGPLPAGKAVYLVDPTVPGLRLFDAAGDLSQARVVGTLGPDQVYLADVKPDSPPKSFDVTVSQEAHPASR